MTSLVASWESVDKHTSISQLSLYWQMSDFTAVLDRVQSGCHSLFFSDVEDKCCINACGNRILAAVLVNSRYTEAFRIWVICHCPP